MFKKTINSLVLMSLLSGTFLTACGGGEESPAEDDNPDGFDSESDIIEPDKPDNLGEADVMDTSGVNGTYTAQSSYQSPAGNEVINVALTLESGEITDVEVSAVETADDTSLQYINQFADDIVGEVVGVNLSEIEDLTYLNGSSLTPIGFNQAVKEIQADVL